MSIPLTNIGLVERILKQEAQKNQILDKFRQGLNETSDLYFLLIKTTSVNLETYHLSFRVFMCTFHLEIFSFLFKFPHSFPIFVLNLYYYEIKL